MRHEQPCQRDPPALARRQIGHRQIGRVGEPDFREGFRRRERRAAQKLLRECEILTRRQGTLQGVSMGDVMERLGKRPLMGILDPDRARSGRQAAGEDFQQGGFSRAVPAQHRQRITGRERERNALENAALAPLAGQIFNA